MYGWKPSSDFIGKSQDRLNLVFQGRFNTRQTHLKDQFPLKETTFSPLRNLVKDDKIVQDVVKRAAQNSADLAKKPLAEPVKRKTEHRTHFGSVDVTFVPPYDWTWTWDAKSGPNPEADASANVNGSMNFEAWTGNDGKTAACAVAVGSFFRPTEGTGIMDVFSAPSFNYSWDSSNVLDSSHSRGWIGLYIGEYTLGGDFVQAVVDQQVNIWDSTGAQAMEAIQAFLSMPVSPLIAIISMRSGCGGEAMRKRMDGLLSGGAPLRRARMCLCRQSQSMHTNGLIWYFFIAISC